MQLRAFRVRMFKSVIDSGPIKTEDLTVLVGKNEAGKTSLLKALHKLNPFKREKYSMDSEWPRGHRKARDPGLVVCTATFDLAPEEVGELGKLLGRELPPMSVDVGRTYAGDLVVSLPPHDLPPAASPESAAAWVAATDLPGESSAGEGFRKAALKCIEELRVAIKEGRSGDLAGLSDPHVAALNSALSPETEASQRGAEQEFVKQYPGRLQELRKRIQAVAAAHKKATEFVTEHLPTFIYMDEYRAFQGSTLLDQVRDRRDKSRLTEEDKTLLMIMALSGLNLDEEVRKGAESDREQRQYDLDDAGKTLTNDIEGRWGQLRYVVKYGADGHQFFTFVSDEKDGDLIKLEERSKGFQWFFSFDLLFMHESKGQFKGCVLLLDEPGLHLHPDGQKDLLKRLEVYAKGNTLVYSSHLPFMIDLRHPERIRVVSESESGSVVTDDLTESQPEAKLTLQAALGISGSQSYLVAARNLVVEGADDFWIVSELSNLLVRSGRAGLDDDVLVTAAGGAPEVAYIATFMIGQELEVVALLDSDTEGDTARDRLVKKWLTRYKGNADQVLSLGEAVGAAGRPFAIEDLFPEDLYLKYVREVYGREISLSGKDLALKPGGMLAKRVEAGLSELGVRFNKGSVAKRLRKYMRDLKSAEELPPQTLKYSEALMKAIGTAFKATGKE